MRSLGIDLLRGLAVMLVLFRHSTFSGLLHDIGWIGVDLFFVLSGFLVSSLVFNEYKATGSFKFKMFFLRRGFKIYPAFYFYLVVSLCVNYFEHGISYETRFILAEVFFLQSYLPHVWTHTWSLAVEEHFYIALALISSFRISKLNPAKGHRLLWYLGAALLLILVMRVIVCYPKRFQAEFAFFSTHLRMDGILVGVIIAYLKHFTNFLLFFRKHQTWFVLLLPLLLWTPFVLPGAGFQMNTYGLTSLNIGFGVLVLFAVDGRFDFKVNSSRLIGWILRSLAFIGIHSYSIYLWHLLVLQECQQMRVEDNTRNFIYLLLAILIGIIFSYAVERPFLKWRELLTVKK
jgi:peptidoglycan/LPS O-acetylase OafA/YrhL